LPEVPPDYYWRYFRTVTETSLHHHAHLFSPHELQQLQSLLALPKAAQQLFVRLFTRVGTLFRRSRLVYPEIGDLEAPLVALEEAGFVARNPPQALASGEALALLTIPALKGLAAALELPTGGRKGDLLARITEGAGDSLGQRLVDVEEFVQLRGWEPCTVAQIAFFGNRHQDQTEFVLVDLEFSAYHDYAVDREELLFPSRGAMDAFVAAAARWDEAYLAWEEGDHTHLFQLGREALAELDSRPQVAPYRRRVDPARYDDRLARLAARELERVGDLEGAVQFYQALVSRPRSVARAAAAADRLGLALRRLERGDEWTALTAQLLVNDRLDDVSRYVVERRRGLLKLGADARKQLQRPPVIDFEFEGAGHQGPKALYRVGEEALVVEEAVLQSMEYEGIWCENSLASTLFGLLLWDELFAPVAGMFQHPFQDGPLDLATETFYENRKGRIRARLRQLSRCDVQREVEARFARHAGTRCRGVNWDLLPAQELGRAAVALGPGLIPILERLARHPRRHRRGMPDLFLWGPGGALVVEVKGPGDQPSVEQMLWHDYLLRHGVDVRIARVRRAKGLADISGKLRGGLDE